MRCLRLSDQCYFSPLLLISLLAAAVASPSYLWGQRNRSAPDRKFNAGDEIEYLWGSKWYPGTVLEVDGSGVAIEYTWGNSPRREKVDAFKLRFKWEASAITPMRFWSDASKKFRIRAAALAIKDGYVKLHKEDGSEISVPIDKLSSSDQRILKQAETQAGPPVPAIPPLSEFRRQSSGRFASWNEARDLSGVSPDPPPSFASIPMKGVGFPRIDFHEDLNFVEPIGGSAGWVLAATINGFKGLPTRVLWIALAEGQVKRVQLLPPAERIVAVDPPNRQLVSLNEEGPRLTLWRSDPSMEEPEPLKSWISSSEENWGSWNNWVAIVGRNRVLHEWAKHRFVVWDTETEQEAYRIDQESFFSARPVLSPGKRYLALPEDNRVRMIETDSGQTVASLQIEGGSAAGVGFSPDGQQLAVLTHNQLAVWQLGSASPPERYRADTIGTPFSATVEWVDNHLLLVDRSVLYDLRHSLPVWNYKAKTFEVKSDGRDTKTQTVIAGKLCYAVNLGSGNGSGFVVGAVELPGPGVREATDTLDPESLYIIRRGHPVAISVNCGQYNTQVEAALKQQIADNGWTYDPSSSTVLEAEMGRGEQQTIEYKRMHGGGESFRISVHPYFSRLKLMHGDKVAWQHGGGSGAPSVMFLKDGESAQAKVNEMQKPYPGLFADVDVPEKVFDPEKKKGLGTSLISSRGLTPQ